MLDIQFETVIESGIIRVPEQYTNLIPTVVKVTLVPVSEPSIRIGTKSKASALSNKDFCALKINTKNWKFNREEANERH